MLKFLQLNLTDWSDSIIFR